MLSLSTSVRIYYATELTDMRKGIDGLRVVVESTLEEDPYTATVLRWASGRVAS